MPWWFWIVLWVVLVVVCALFLAFLGFRIFRQTMAVLRDIDEAGQMFTLPDGRSARAEDLRPQSAAVFLEPAEVRSKNRMKADLRQRGRSQRRVKRRTDRGQPQLLRDMPHL